MIRKNQTGSALVLVLVASMFLIILTAGAFRYFQTNVDTQIWTRERIQAKLSAEAGVNLSTHMLIAGAGLPSSDAPEPILGTEISHFILPGDMGTIYATVDPSNRNPEITTANAYMIRCISFVQGHTIESFGMESIIMPENLARFSVFQDNPSLNGYYPDGYRFDGPFYSNGPTIIFSESVTHENDVFFYSYNSTSPYWIYGKNQHGSHETTPAAGNLEMRPYHRLNLGAPYFELNVDTIAFGAAELNWQGVESAAISGGLHLSLAQVPHNSRLVLSGTSLFVRRNATEAPVEYDLSSLENPVVWIDNNWTDRIYLRGDMTTGAGFDMELTLGCKGPVFMSGSLVYNNQDLEDPDNTNLLGIMTVYGDMIIADAPDILPDPLWNGYGERWQIGTAGTVTYSAVLVALEGEIKAEDAEQPVGFHEFQVIGGYMCQAEGWTNTSSAGFLMVVYFDPRLLFMHPPFFPTTANWNTTMWAERPDMIVSDVTNGVPEY